MHPLRIKFFDWYMKHLRTIFWTAATVCFWSYLLPIFFPSLNDITILNSNLSVFSVLFFISGGVCGYFAGAWHELRKQQANVNPEISFDDEQKNLVLKILEEKDAQKKKALEQQASALRQEHESIMSENLRRRDGTFVTDWRESLLVARKRLADEGLYLRDSNSANRRMGVLMATLGICCLGLYILFSHKGGGNGNIGVFFANYWPYFTIVVIFEIIAIFYLRLYYQILRRIETNKNELTNIELRLTSGLMLIDKVDKKNLKSLADDIAKEERNFVLGKNESSAGIGVDRVAEIITKIIKGGL